MKWPVAGVRWQAANILLRCWLGLVEVMLTVAKCTQM